METVSLTEARKRLGQLVDAVERGESVVITRRGRRVVRLVREEKKVRRGLPDLTAFRASIHLRGKSLSQTLIDMRKEARY